ncbi:MAG: hypothetical protein HXY28_13975 [Hydrogenophilaceae bacterium]|jgi:hypothetical protein|nr:hypothetical protein [Hydrogenophilaceae bacterium]
MPIETNCFKIEGLDALSTTYRLFKIVGLNADGLDYYGNLQRIIRNLSYQLRAPITVHHRDGEAFLLSPLGVDPPEQLLLVGAVASLRPTNETIELAFNGDQPELDDVRVRFLQFAMQNPLFRDARLWQPGAGKPFFFRRPDRALGNLDLYEGFTPRVVPHPDGGFGVVIDLRRKLISRAALSPSITRDEANRLKGRSCLYKMGDDWFEVSLSGLSDYAVGQPSIPLDGAIVSLGDYLHSKSPKPVAAAIARLSPDGAAILYRTNGPTQRSAPAALCHLIEDTHGRAGAQSQPHTIIQPDDRHRQLNRLAKMFLGSFRIGDVELRVAPQAGLAKPKLLIVPRLLYGGDRTLEPREDGPYVDAVAEYGRQRLNMLNNSAAGFYERSTLARQLVVMPRSVHDSSGPQFLADLRAQLKAIYPAGGDYNPEVVVYDDLNGTRNFASQSRAIREAMDAERIQPGFALVIVHRYEKRARAADQLAAWVVKDFASQRQLTASVIHTDMINRGYIALRRNGQTQYVVKDSEQRRIRGYIRNVAINKILLTNGKWPFVLDTALNAEVVVGIDVKNSTAAFTLIADGGRIIRFSTKASRQKEQLLKNQVSQIVADLIRKERRYLQSAPKEIVIHRDGRAWPSEIEGLKEACEALQQEGFIASDWRLTILEISKSAPAPLRMFSVKQASGSNELAVQNPVVGSWLQVGETEGFVCTTGRPFSIPGTANPLHVRRVHGTMSIEKCLADVFDLSCLTWGRPEGAMRLPISIKLCDRSLYEEAEDVNEDEIEYGNDNVAETSR